MRPDSSALCPEQLPFIKQTRKEPRFAWLKFQRVPNNTVTRREEHWCHLRNTKLIGVPQITSRWSTFPLHCVQSNCLLKIKDLRSLDLLDWNSRESPTTLLQDEKNADVTQGMQNCSVSPKSNWDEDNFPCIGSITTPRSTSYRKSGLTPFRNL